MIRIALIGLGKIARDQHRPAIAGEGGFDLVASVDPVGGIEGLPNFPDLAALAAAGLEVEAVAICTPPQVRARLAAEAIARGWHVLLEKPPAATLTELADLTAAAQGAGVCLFAAWHLRFAPMIEPAHAWCAARRIVRGRVAWREDVRRWHPGQTWLWAPGGLGVFDPGINALSVLTDILPLPTVTAARLEVPENAHTPIRAELALTAGGAPIDVAFDFLQTGPQTWDIELEAEGGERLRLGQGASVWQEGDGPERHEPDREYPNLYRHFAGLIGRGAIDADPAPLRLVADALLIAETVRVEPFVE